MAEMEKGFLAALGQEKMLREGQEDIAKVQWF
jgi:hypothetical protein